MNVRTLLLLVAAAGASLGCATSTTNYTPSTEPKGINTKFATMRLRRSLELVRKGLGRDFFVINNWTH